MSKFKDMVTSPRFIQLLLIAFIQSLVVFHVVDSEQGISLVNILSALFGASVVIRTVDRQADVKAGSTTVNIPKEVSSVTATTTKE